MPHTSVSVLLRDSVVSARLLRESSDLAVTLRLSVQPCFALISMSFPRQTVGHNSVRAAALSPSARREMMMSFLGFEHCAIGPCSLSLNSLSGRRFEAVLVWWRLNRIE